MIAKAAIRQPVKLFTIGYRMMIWAAGGFIMAGGTIFCRRVSNYTRLSNAGMKDESLPAFSQWPGIYNPGIAGFRIHFKYWLSFY